MICCMYYVLHVLSKVYVTVKRGVTTVAADHTIDCGRAHKRARQREEIG